MLVNQIEMNLSTMQPKAVPFSEPPKRKEPSQNDMILDYMIQNHGITSYQAFLDCGCTRLSARIFDLRHAGHNIIGEYVTRNGKRFIRYRVADE